MLFLGRKEYYFFSLLCLFLVNSSSSTTRKRNRPAAATAMVLLSLSFFLSFILQTLLYDKTDFTVIENYPYTERERERKESVVRSLLCVCVIEMWDDRDKKEIQKKDEEGKNAPLFFGVLKLKKIIKRTQKEKEEIRIRSKYEST